MQEMFYDYKRDSNLQQGDIILFYDDGSRERFLRDKQESSSPAIVREVAKSRDHWSTAGQIFFTDGLGFGVGSEGQAMCMGAEGSLVEAIVNPKFRCGDDEVDRIIAMERDIQFREREANYGRDSTGIFEAKCRAPKAPRRTNKRIRPLRYLGHKCSDFRSAKTATKLPLPIA